MYYFLRRIHVEEREKKGKMNDGGRAAETVVTLSVPKQRRTWLDVKTIGRWKKKKTMCERFVSFSIIST